jgi:secreted Zn-dependent insulinase-like peptidase
MQYKNIFLLLNFTLTLLLLSSCIHPATQKKRLKYPIIHKSIMDSRKYRYLTLSNGLKTILISDPNTNKSAASLNVHIGSMDAPKDRKALSHFLEHILVLSSKKYPKKEEFQNILYKNSGWLKTYTSRENTSYSFNIHSKIFNEALDRFSHFFIDPLLDSTNLLREKKAIHSKEHLKKIYHRQKINHVLKFTHHPQHPNNQLSIGNLKTLADRSNHLLIDDLLTHYKDYYSANRMSLAIFGRENLKTLSLLAEKKFSSIPSNKKHSSPLKISPYLKKQFSTKINIAIQSSPYNQSLELYFPLPYNKKDFKNKPLKMISYLFNEQRQGSLISHLKNQGLIESLNAYYNRTDDFQEFTIQILLTKKGFLNYSRVTESVFSYLQLLNDSTKNNRYFNELKHIANIKFNFKIKSSPFKTVQSLSEQLHNYSPKHILDAHYYYSHHLFKHYLSYLTPQNMHQILIGSHLKTNKIEPIYKTPYSIRMLTPSEIKHYHSPKIISALQFPKVNTFIPKNLNLKPLKNNKQRNPIFSQVKGIKLWHKQDRTFRVPKIVIYVKLHHENKKMDITSIAKKYLYLALINNSLNELKYPTRLAGLNYTLSHDNKNINYRINGYGTKSIHLLEKINQRIRYLHIEPSLFKYHKQRLIRQWSSAHSNRPHIKMLLAIEKIQYNTGYSYKNLALALKKVNMAQLSQYIEDFHQNIKIKSLVYGNLTSSDANKLSEKFALFNPNNEYSKKHSKKQLFLNQSGHPLIYDLAIKDNDSSLIIDYISKNTSTKKRLQYRLLWRLLDDPFYQSMGTIKEQYGYIANTNHYGFLGIRFLIMSKNNDPVEIKNYIDDFLKQVKSKLIQLNPNKFFHYKSEIINDLQQKYHSFDGRAEGYWVDINKLYASTDKVCFNSFNEMEKMIKKINIKQILHLFDETFKTIQPIIVRNFGKTHRQNENAKKARKDTSICRTSTCMKKQLTLIFR